MSPHFTEELTDTFPANTGIMDGNGSIHTASLPVRPLNGATNGTNGASYYTNGASNGASNGISNGIANGIANGIPNGIANGHSGSSHKTSNLRPASPDCVHDLLCVGFGPASLAIAVALHDGLDSHSLPHGTSPNVLFLEKQEQFAWHAGMLLPGAKMQISFIKDMASLRDPRSHFTFLNYVHNAGRLVEFTNLSTFLPSRVEYEDYLRWCAGHFDNMVRYGQEVVSVSPEKESIQGAGGGTGPVQAFVVTSRDERGATTTYKARNVIMATGGQASIPKCLPQLHPRVVHSSKYAHMVPKILSDVNAPYRVAVVGAGQSAAEIFNNIQTLYPNSRTSLVMRQEFLKPSDDSPFVNSIFNPSFTDTIFGRPRDHRRSLIADTRATNYGVVRLELIEHLYERMYDQHRELGPDESRWPHRILGRHEVLGLEESSNIKQAPKLRVRPTDAEGRSDYDQLLDVDLVIVATGYHRDVHLDMLRDTWSLLPEKSSKVKRCDGWELQADDGTTRAMEVSRDYKVKFGEGKTAPGSGVYLQGCCERTHGLSDTLLSVLAVRSGEIVDSIFGRA
ncbi:L-lysine 6-monooxygenase (NADPH-requiring)-domain-containing protein [Zalerion maritima]|uniref:L-ornithine N(5)-monooxygenase [NAD(P)H] n=1 Tax=Zalerion maritima TaxID=339359 RepID=A0AAD5RLE4_9PEZI|nr:L-lysine 6-monooxygenase (NADPH-requiring)-domain-containing protein [Zalerion maritima]